MPVTQRTRTVMSQWAESWSTVWRLSTEKGRVQCNMVTMGIQAVDRGNHMERVEFKPLVDSGVHKNLLSESDWKVMKKKKVLSEVRTISD